MGRYTPAWAMGFALGASTLVLGFALSHDIVLLGGAVVTLGSLAGQSFLPGPPTEEERERDREVRDEASQEVEPQGLEIVEETPEDDTPERGEEQEPQQDIGGDDQEAPEASSARPTEFGSRGSGNGVTRGKCGNCGTRLKLSDRRPVKAICPQCGRSRVLGS